MKKTIYCSMVLALAALSFAACTKNAPEEAGPGQRMHVVPSMASGNTGVTAADDIRTFMLRISDAAKSQYNYYTAMTLKNGEWKSRLINSTGATADEDFQILWANSSSPVTATAIFCDNNVLAENYFSKLTVSLVSDQTTPAKIKATDLLYMAPKQFFPTDGDIKVEFSHMKAKLKVKVTLDDEFNAVPGTTTNPIEDIQIGNFTNKYDFLVYDGIWQRNATAQATMDKTIAPCETVFTPGELGTKKAEAEYECLVIPSTLPANVFAVTIKINGTDYEWKATTETLFEINHSYELALKVGKGVVTLASPIKVNDWNDDTLPDGDTDEKAFAVWDGSVSSISDIQGSGTKDDPFLMTSGADLACLAKVIKSGSVNGLSNGRYFKLTNDIDLAGKEWTPIGYQKDYAGNSPYGHFDGNGKTIKNLKVDKSGTGESAGFFGSGTSIVISDLTITDADVKADEFAGILVGTVSQAGGSTSAKPEIINCHVSGKVTSNGLNTTGGFGGIVGQANYAIVRNCTADVTVVGDQCTGGIAGASYMSSYYNCSVRGDVTGYYAVGGFVGALEGLAEAKDCISYANVTAKNWNCGGFVGYFNGYDGGEGTVCDCRLSNCTVYGTTTSALDYYKHHVGGMAGYMANATATDCKAAGEVTVTKKYTEKDADGPSQAGTFLGFDGGNAETVRCSYVAAKNTMGFDVIGASEGTSTHDITAK